MVFVLKKRVDVVGSGNYCVMIYDAKRNICIFYISHLKKSKGVIIEIFDILCSYEDKDLSRFSNLHFQTFKLVLFLQ